MRTRSERDPKSNFGRLSPSLLIYHLVATRFRNPPNSKTQELSAVEQRRESIEASLGDQAAVAGKNKEREAETKGEEGDRSRSCR